MGQTVGPPPPDARPLEAMEHRLSALAHNFDDVSSKPIRPVQAAIR